MPLNYDFMMSLPPRETRARYEARDVMLYALGLGVGADDALSPAALRYVYEGQLQVLPTMAVVIGTPGFWLKDPQYGIDWKRLLHGEQMLELHRALPVAADIVSRLTIDEIYDKGAAKGAIMYTTRVISDAGSGEKFATLRASSFLRGDGGCGGKTEGAPKPHAVPDRAPDLSIDIATRQDQALIYRLSGDYNPLHVDPEIARGGGFERPILHGLCSYGVVGRALLQGLCGGEVARFQRFNVRFSSPVYPGETIRTQVWREDGTRCAVRARVVERDLVVIDNGLFEFKP